MISRRKSIQLLSSIPFAGLLFEGLNSITINTSKISPSYRDFYKELGIRTFINATGTHTFLTGSLMRPEVLEAINYASHQYVNLLEMQDKVGARIATLLDCEAAMVTAGAASALTLGTAATITGTDPQKIIQLPNLPGPQLEVIVQKSHRFGYDHAVRNTGVKMIEVETKRELERAVNSRTVMMLFAHHASNTGKIKDQEFVDLGKKYNLPTFIDCAASVPPEENLWKYTKMGFDLVTFSGGKGLRGPQSAGVLLGRKDLIDAARLQVPPYGNTIGRGMKVNKEEILGMMVALEEYLKIDHARERKELEERVELISNTARSVPGVNTEIVVQEFGNHVPQVRVFWDETRIKLTPEQVSDKLRFGHPSIETITLPWLGDGLFVNIWMARPGEERIVAVRLKEVLTDALG
jgi:L-seryl-tRNA(Ser) seleniumtransferase